MVAFGVGNGNPLQGSCPENTMDGGAWLVTVHEVTKSWTQLSTRAHSSFTVLCSFLLYNKVSQPHTHIPSFLVSSSFRSPGALSRASLASQQVLIGGLSYTSYQSKDHLQIHKCFLQSRADTQYDIIPNV